MANDAIDLESVRIRYDHYSGVFRITSIDPRLRGKPFQLTISRNSAAVRSLLEVFQEEGIITADDELPASVTLSSIGDWQNGLDDHAISRTPRPVFSDTRLRLPVGQTTGNQPVAMDLSMAPHTLVTGAPGQGKSGFLAALAGYSIESGKKVRIVGDERWGALILHRMTGQKSINPKQLMTEFRERLDLLDRVGKMDYIEYENKVGAMPPVFVFADELSNTPMALDWMEEILDEGERVGFYLFAGAHSVFDIPALTDESMLLNFGRRIHLGQESQKSEISPRLLEGLGRATLRVDGSEPLLVQLLAPKAKG